MCFLPGDTVIAGSGRKKDMERLTIPDKKIDGGLQRTVIDTREVRKHATTLYWALKKYEDTGLSPEQVEELKEKCTAKAPTVHVNKNDTKIGAVTFKAGVRVHRCSVCGCLITPVYNYCHRCGQALNWSKEEPNTRTRTCRGCFGAANNDCGRCKEGCSEK